jgi:hypothetical protein
MAPGAALAWWVAGAPEAPAVQEVSLAALASVLVVAAAARSEGLHADRNVAQVAIRRLPSHAMNLLVLFLLLALAGGVGGTFGGMLGEFLGLPGTAPELVGAALALLPVLTRLWPLAALGMVVPDELGQSSATLPWIWRGPGYTSARRLARDFGSVVGTTAIVGMAYLWLMLLLATDLYRGESALPFLVEAASYGVFLPLLSWLTVVETRRAVEHALVPPSP